MGRFVAAEVDLETTFFPLRRGRGDPTTRILPGQLWRASRTPEGPVTVRFVRRGDGVDAFAWGAGSGWALDRAPAWLGLADGSEAFDPPPGAVRDARRRHRGLRIPRTGLIVEHLVPTILEQKVTGVEARRAYRRLALALAEPAPGDVGLVLPPDPVRVAALPYYAMHPFGVERRRADVLRAVCARAAWLDAAAEVGTEAAASRMRAVAGVGPWSVAEVARLGLGDADAVSVRDFHLPHVVSWALAGEPRGSDERMLELLAPYRPFRGLTQLLLERSGARAPAFGPRMDVRTIERL